jgi:hypothetical protein
MFPLGDDMGHNRMVIADIQNRHEEATELAFLYSNVALPFVDTNCLTETGTAPRFSRAWPTAS